jgi:hypothetical protein
MPTADLEKAITLTPVSPKDTLIPGFEGHTSVFRATGPRRIDNVQVGFGPKSTVEFVRASVLVTSENAWPKSLFAVIGEPKHARYSEWVWFDQKCGLTLRLVHLEPLGGDDGSQGYTVEIRRTLQPIPDPQ